MDLYFLNPLITYEEDDSIFLKKGYSTFFIDITDLQNTKPNWKKVLFGGNFIFNQGRHQFLYGGLIDRVHIDFNTAEGFKYGMEFTYSYYNENGKHFRRNHDIDYSFGRKRMANDIGMNYRYNGLMLGNLYLSGGRITTDINENTGIPSNLNTITTLFLKENYLKVHQKDYIEIAHRIDVANGLDFLADFEFAHRKLILNNFNFSFTDSFHKEFSSNNPWGETINTSPVDGHYASIARFRLRYTPKYNYIIEIRTLVLR